jgi:hypothetical protein
MSLSLSCSCDLPELPLPLSFKEHLANCCVLVSTVTRNLNRLKPALRALFPSEISLSPHPESRVDQYVDDALSNLLSGKRDRKNIQATEPISHENLRKSTASSACESHSTAANRAGNPCSTLQSDVNVKVKEQLLKVLCCALPCCSALYFTVLGCAVLH